MGDLIRKTRLDCEKMRSGVKDRQGDRSRKSRSRLRFGRFRDSSSLAVQSAVGGGLGGSVEVERRSEFFDCGIWSAQKHYTRFPEDTGD